MRIIVKLFFVELNYKLKLIKIMIMCQNEVKAIA